MGSELYGTGTVANNCGSGSGAGMPER
jgi:hypothetical protein